MSLPLRPYWSLYFCDWGICGKVILTVIVRYCNSFLLFLFHIFKRNLGWPCGLLIIQLSLWLRRPLLRISQTAASKLRILLVFKLVSNHNKVIKIINHRRPTRRLRRLHLRLSRTNLYLTSNRLHYFEFSTVFLRESRQTLVRTNFWWGYCQ